MQRPTQRLQRYTLLLEQIIKYTADDNNDKEILDSALQTIRVLCRESDDRVHEAEKRLRIVELERKLVKKNNEPCVCTITPNFKNLDVIFYIILNLKKKSFLFCILI